MTRSSLETSASFLLHKKILNRNPHGHTTHAFLWVPLVYAALNVLLAIALCQTTIRDEDLRMQGLQMSNIISSTSITILSLTFSLTFLSIQIAAQTYSPRLLDDFIKDPTSKISIAINVGAFAYSYTMSYYLHDEQHVPNVGIHFLTVQAVALVLMFVVFIHYFVNGFRLEKILAKAVTSSWTAAKTLDKLHRNHCHEPTNDSDSLTNEVPSSAHKVLADSLRKEVPSSAYKVLADSSGYVVRYTLEQILDICTKLDVCVRYHPHIGEFVAEGTIMAYVWDAESKTNNNETIRTRILGQKKASLSRNSERQVEERLGKLVAEGVELSTIRVGQLDITLGIQQLSDVAVRALSAAINDPHTAVQAIDSLSALFGQLAHLDFPPFVVVCSGKKKYKKVHLSCPRRSFTFLLSIIDPIRHYGCGDLQVTYRLIRFYGDLGAALKRLNKLDRIPGVLAQLEQCLVFAKRNFGSNGSNQDNLEMRAIRELYEYALEVMAVSNRMVLQRQESVEDDLQDLETTYVRATPAFGETVPEKLKKQVLP